MSDPCLNEQRIAALEADSNRNSEQHKNFYGMIHETDKKQALGDQKHESILTALHNIEKDIKAMKDKPAKRWETVITGVIAAVVAFIVGYFLN